MQINKVSVFLLAAAVCWNPFGRASAEEAKNGSDGVVVMISIDGLAGFYFDDPKAEMPTIRKLAAEGAHAELMRASTPTVTWPNHTTLVTGVSPAKHGVAGNNYFDRVKGEDVALIGDPNFDKDEIVKVPTIYDLAKAKGMKTAAIRWPATRNAASLDWTMPDMRTIEEREKYATPGLVAECAQAGIRLNQDDDKVMSADPYYVRVFDYILRTHRPKLALLHVIDVDHTQHQKGPRTPEAYAAVKAADDQVREVWEEMQRDFPGKATLFIVSDHGFSPVNRTVLPNVILRKAGLITVEDGKTNEAVHVVVQGGGAMLYVRDESRRDEILEQAREAFAKVPGVAKIVGVEKFGDYGVANPKDDPHAPDMIVFAQEGCAFGRTTAGDMLFKDKTETSGTHGHDPYLPHLHATFVACGSGIKPGVKLGVISNMDVAPTIAKLLDLKLPSPEGHVLTEALAK